MKIIKSFNLDLSDLPAAAERRDFTISGTSGAMFSLEIKNEDPKYYNFATNAFQAEKTGLYNKTLPGGIYSGFINFPKITDDDHYDIYLFAEEGTEHDSYNEVRFGDGSIDINSSTGSNSLLMEKIIYQYTNLALSLRTYSPGGAVTVGSPVNDDFVVSRGRGLAKVPFTISCTTTSGVSYKILRQPDSNDAIAFVSPTAAADPVDLPGENIYPTSRAAFTGDDINGAITSGSVVRMDNTDLSAAIAVGDKITTDETTDTVDGNVTSGVKVVMDNNVADKMAVGDRITVRTGTTITAALFEERVVTVAALNPDGDNAKEFSMSNAIAIADGTTLTFSSKINRSLTTVTVVETSGTATDFTMSQAIQFRDNAPLTFWPRKNYQWTLDNIDKITEGMILVPSTNITANTSVGRYEDAITILDGTEREQRIVKNSAPALNTKGQKPTIVKGLVTTQPGDVVFTKQQVLAFGGTTLKVGGYGTSQILNVHGYELEFTDLAIALTPITTTTTAASYSSTSVVVAARDGIMNSVSRVSGVGIDPSTAAPTVSSGANATGAGTIVLSAAQTLENGVTLTFPGAGKTATITGYVEVLKAGTDDAVIYFDMDKLLTQA